MSLFLHLRYKALDLLQVHFFYSIYPYCLRAIKSFDREGRAELFFAFPEGLEPSCCHTATSDRGCGWEDYPTLTLLPDGKRASGVRGVAIARRFSGKRFVRIDHILQASRRAQRCNLRLLLAVLLQQLILHLHTEVSLA